MNTNSIVIAVLLTVIALILSVLIVLIIWKHQHREPIKEIIYRTVTMKTNPLYVSVDARASNPSTS